VYNLKNVIMDYLIKCLNFSQEYFFDNIRIAIKIKNEKLSLFKIKKYYITIITEIDNGSISNIENIFDFVIGKFDEKSHEYKRLLIYSNWYIFNNSINDKNFYEINQKGNIHYKNMINRFAIINKTDGEIYFDPNKIQNRVISERMKFLYTEYNKEFPLNAEKETIFSREFKGLFDVLEVVINDMKK
jgi:hypothetical protein